MKKQVLEESYNFMTTGYHEELTDLVQLNFGRTNHDINSNFYPHWFLSFIFSVAHCMYLMS